jgi:hypothetical protein
MKTLDFQIRLFFTAFLMFSILLFSGRSWALEDQEILRLQRAHDGEPVGDRIAFWAESFLGIPYDQDPLGAYVSRAAIVADDRVDCMYLTFRAVELALSRSPEEALQTALERRFHSRGILKDGKVANYDDRFDYGEDMIASGKWGKDITAAIGPTVRLSGSRGTSHCDVLPRANLPRWADKLKSGDIIFFMTAPEKRVVGEAVGHLCIIRVEGNTAFLVHAGGTKKKGGSVRKVPWTEYVAKMPFIGVKITRFEGDER